MFVHSPGLEWLIISKEEYGNLNAKRQAMSYAHYVCMGGFVTHVSAIDDVLSSLTIIPNGVRLMEYLGHHPEVSDKSIQQKSKAEYLAKSLVCIQEF
jgi:hypothetical protein